MTSLVAVTEFPDGGFEPVAPVIDLVFALDRRANVVHDLAQVPDIRLELPDHRLELHVREIVEADVGFRN